MPEQPPEAYVQLNFTLATSDLEDQSNARLEEQWEGWTPNDGDLEEVLIEALSPMAAAVARMAQEMPPAALVAFGEKLLGTPLEEGTPATATATFVVEDEEGHEIPAGSEVDINGFAFSTVADLVIPNGSKEGSVEIAANEDGEAANDLTGLSYRFITFPTFVTEMTLAEDTAGGKDEEDQNEYLDKISNELRLRAKSIITLRDFEILAVTLQGIGAALAFGDEEKPRNIEVYLRDDEGRPVTLAIKEVLKALYEETRMVNAVVTLHDATYLAVNAKYKVLALPEADPVALKEALDSTLATALEPDRWGVPNTEDSDFSWVKSTTVPLNKVIAILGAVQGVDYVEALELNGKEEDLKLPEPVGLPEPGTIEGTVDTPVI